MLTEILLSVIEESPLRIGASSYSPSSVDLENSLVAVGQLSPITIRAHPSKPNYYQIIFGNRRFKAAQRLGWKSITANVVEASDSDALAMALCENLDREDFTDYEKALVLDKLHNVTKKTYLEIAKMIGKSPSFVSQHVAMLHLFSKDISTEEEQMKVLSKLSEKHARVLLRIEDNEKRWSTAKLVVAANLCTRELEKIVNSGKSGPKVVSNSRNAIEGIISAMANGLSTNDLRPCFDVISEKHFSLFSRFPPYVRMDKDSAKRHIFEVVHSMNEFKEKVTDLDIRVFGDFAYASMYVSHRLNLEGKTIKTKTRATIIFAKENGWKIVHEHWSPLTPSDALGPEETQKLELGLASQLKVGKHQNV